jgi:sugar-specific transcriptional regulator TrmB
MDEKELASQLGRFGLTAQEAGLLVLLARVQNSGATGLTGSAVAGLSGLNRVRAYQLLQRLADIGLVEVNFGRPKRYAATNPQTLVRRLVAVHESKLTELTHLEEDVAQALIKASPLKVDLDSNQGGESNVTLLRGLSNIQSLARRVMESRDLHIVVSDESEDHIFTTIKYMSKKPSSAKVIFATLNKDQESFEGNRVEIGGYSYEIRLYRGELPTMILTPERCLMFFYVSQPYRPRPLSPRTVRTVVSECVVVDNARDVRQVETVFQSLWGLSS